MSTFSFAEVLPQVAERFAVWEIFGEGRQYLWDIEEDFAQLAPSYDLRFTAHAPISDINIASFNEEVRAMGTGIVARSVEAAGRMGIERLTIHPGLRMPMARWDDEHLRELTLRAARALGRLGREHGVEVCLENMANGWVHTFQDPEWFEGLFDGEGPLRFCFDVAHAHTNGAEVVAGYTRDLAEATANVHVSDNGGELDSHWVLGRGNVPLKDVVKGLEGSGYRGNYVIESNTFEEGVESLPAMQAALGAAEG